MIAKEKQVLVGGKTVTEGFTPVTWQNQIDTVS